jgi:hypothetical protein
MAKMSHTRNEYIFLRENFMEDEEWDGRVTYLFEDERWLEGAQCLFQIWASDITNVETCVLTLQC